MSTPDAPLVSVVIPAYNAAAFIVDTLESVRAQSYRSWELIVVDDGSSDGTEDVVRAYLERHCLPGLCTSQANRGIASARNTGMRAAAGPYIALLDHDDVWYPDKLAVVMREFERHPEVGLVCHNENIRQHGRIVRTSRNGPASPRMYERLLFGGNVLSPSASVFRKHSAMAIGGFRENPEFNTVEDYDFWMRLSRTCRFHFIDQPLGEYLVVERAASRRIEYHHTNMETMLRDHFAAYWGGRPWLGARVRMRRRLSVVYRSALGQLMAHGEFPDKQREYAIKMMKAFPLAPKNVVRALQWSQGAWRRRLVQSL